MINHAIRNYDYVLNLTIHDFIIDIVKLYAIKKSSKIMCLRKSERIHVDIALVDRALTSINRRWPRMEYWWSDTMSLGRAQ